MAIKTGPLKDPKTGDIWLPQTDASLVIGMPEISTNIELDGNSDAKTASPKAVKTFVENKISTVYKAAGSAASVAALGTLVAEHEGFVYNMSADFTTTADFVEGAGKTYPAGTNVVIVNTGTAGSPVYKYDVLAGMVDLSGYERQEYRVTEVTQQSDNNHYPTAKAVWDAMVAGKEVFWATYGTTTYQNIIDARASGKMVFVTYQSRYYMLVAIQTASIIFACPQSYYLYRVSVSDADVWSNNSYEMEVKSNKVTSFGSTPSDSKYPSEKLVYDSLQAQKIFWATYGTTTATQVAEAVTAGKLVAMNYNNAVFFLAETDTNNYHFENVYTNRLRRITLKISDSSWGSMSTVYSEDGSNKVSTITGYESNTSKYPNTKAVADALALKYTKPSDGIPKSDLSAEVQSAVDNASITKLADQTFTFRKSPAKATRGRLNAVKGKSLVLNQGLPEFGTNRWGSARATINVISGEEVEVTGTEDGNAGYYLFYDYYSVAGHKYFIRASYKVASGTSNQTGFKFGGNALIGLTFDGNWHDISTVVTTPIKDRFFINAAYQETISAKKAKIIDLTLMFGAGNEPNTAAEFEALYPLYYNQNAGQIINNKATAIEVTGRNQWDEEWENGYYDVNGLKQNGPNYIRSKNFISVLPNTTYCCCVLNSNLIIVCEYDADFNFVDRKNDGSSSSPIHLYTTTSRTRYVTLTIGSSGKPLTTYNHDICINLSDDSFNGQYEPYKKNTIELNIPTITGKLNGEGESVVIAPDGLCSAGTVYDDGIVENGYLTKIVKRIGKVDLGTLNYTKSGTRSSVFFVQGAIQDEVIINAQRDNRMCSKYLSVAASSYSLSTMPDKSIKGLSNSAGSVYICDSAYDNSDAATFKTAMSGVMLYYELAEPLTYILDTPIYVGFSSLPGGTEKRLPEDTASSVIAPFRADFQYGLTEEEMMTESTEIFWAKYGSTTAKEVDAAVASGKLVVCRYSGRSYIYNGSVGTNYYFTCLYGTINGGYLILNPSNDAWQNGSVSFEQQSSRVSSFQATPSNSKYPSEKLVYDSLYPAIVTTQPSGGFAPNIVYDLGELTGSVTFSLATPTDANIANAYHWTFDTGSTAPTITWPANIVWAEGSAPTISASKHYEIMIRGHYGNALEFDLYVPAS